MPLSVLFLKGVQCGLIIFAKNVQFFTVHILVLALTRRHINLMPKLHFENKEERVIVWLASF
jgi:hypothetical protein